MVAHLIVHVVFSVYLYLLHLRLRLPCLSQTTHRRVSAKISRALRSPVPPVAYNVVRGDVFAEALTDLVVLYQPK